MEFFKGGVVKSMGRIESNRLFCAISTAAQGQSTLIDQVGNHDRKVAFLKVGSALKWSIKELLNPIFSLSFGHLYTF